MKVSVVMPAFNAEATIGEAVESILNQSHSAFELIVVDDGSTDRTGDILRGYSGDGRVKLISQENRGVVAALNRGVASAGQELIARADADDYYSPNRLAQQVAEMERYPDLVMCCTDFYKVFDDRTRILVEMPRTHEEIVRAIFVSNIVMHSSVMFRKSSFIEVGGYRPAARHIEDWDLWFRLASVGRLGSVQGALSFLRVGSTTVSARNEVYQARMGLLLRWRILRNCGVPPTCVRYMARPALKVLLGQSGLSVVRQMLGLRRYGS